MRIAAHRGDSYNAHENTLRAFALALEEGVDMIETDVHLTKDGVPVLIHDPWLDRTTDGNGAVAEKTLKELQGVNAGDVFDEEKIPLLSEFLTLVKDEKTELNIELKVYSDREGKQKAEECADKVIAMVEQYGMGERIYINSFDAYVLEYIHKKYNGKYRLHGYYPYPIMRNVSGDPSEYLFCACIFDPHGVHKKENYDFLLSRGIEPWIGASCTVETVLKRAQELGARLVTTNNPVDTKRKLEGKKG